MAGGGGTAGGAALMGGDRRPAITPPAAPVGEAPILDPAGVAGPNSAEVQAMARSGCLGAGWSPAPSPRRSKLQGTMLPLSAKPRKSQSQHSPGRFGMMTVPRAGPSIPPPIVSAYRRTSAPPLPTVRHCLPPLDTLCVRPWLSLHTRRVPITALFTTQTVTSFGFSPRRPNAEHAESNRNPPRMITDRTCASMGVGELAPGPAPNLGQGPRYGTRSRPGVARSIISLVGPRDGGGGARQNLSPSCPPAPARRAGV